MDLDYLAENRAAYARNKNGRNNERWFDWTTPAPRTAAAAAAAAGAGGGDSLDALVSTNQRQSRRRRAADPVPYDVDPSLEPSQPKRFESDHVFGETAAMYKKTIELRDKGAGSNKYQTTSIFGGRQGPVPGVIGRAGKGWCENMGWKAPPPAETKRNEKFEKKYQSSSFPDKYESYCNKEFQKMHDKALNQ